MLKAAFDAVMNPYNNAFSTIPKIVKFQLMVTLSVLWSMIFCVSAGLLVWLPGYVAVHVVLLGVGLFGTNWIFQRARKRQL